MSRHLRNSSCSSAVQRPVALGMDLASRARALFWALLGAFGPATVLDVNDAKSFFSAAAFATVLGAVVVVRAGAAGVMAAMASGVGAFNFVGGELECVLPLKGEKRCGESAAGLRAMQDINTATLYVRDALVVATKNRLFCPRRTLKTQTHFFQFVFQGSHADNIRRHVPWDE